MIVCAALQFEKDGMEIVIPCHRHYNGYEILYDLGVDYKKFSIIEGFIDNQNNFLNRYEAQQHWISCGQSSEEDRQRKKEKHEDMLFSEDLY